MSNGQEVRLAGITVFRVQVQGLCQQTLKFFLCFNMTLAILAHLKHGFLIGWFNVRPILHRVYLDRSTFTNLFKQRSMRNHLISKQLSKSASEDKTPLIEIIYLLDSYSFIFQECLSILYSDSQYKNEIIVSGFGDLNDYLWTERCSGEHHEVEEVTCTAFTRHLLVNSRGRQLAT